jgi:hypothetical protein
MHKTSPIVTHLSFLASPHTFLLSVSDPIHFIRIRIRHCRLNTDQDPGFWWPKMEKIYLSLRLHKGCPSCRRSLQPSKENIQHFKTWNFLFFLFLWVIFALLDPDPDSESRSRYRRSDLIESGSNPDPDPKHCFRYLSSTLATPRPFTPLFLLPLSPSVAPHLTLQVANFHPPISIPPNIVLDCECRSCVASVFGTSLDK